MRRHNVVIAAVVAAVVLAGVASAAAPSAEFQDSQYEATQTGSVVMTVELNDTDTTRLQVGSESAGYTLTATLVDEDGDGTVAVEFVVPNAGTDDRTLFVTDSDSVENVSESEFHEPPLALGAYRLTVSPTGEQASDVGRLTVEEADQSTAVTTTYAPTDDDLADTTTTSGTTMAGAGTTDDTSNGDSPGFGVVAGLVGLLAAALLAARR